MTDPKSTTKVVELQKSIDDNDAKRILREAQFDRVADAGDGRMTISLGHDGKAVAAPGVDLTGEGTLVQGPIDNADQIDGGVSTLMEKARALGLDLESAPAGKIRQAEEVAQEQFAGMTDEEIDQRTEALTRLIIEKMAWEREQIAQVADGYAADCMKRAEELEGAGNRESDRLKSTGHAMEAKSIQKKQAARAAAFKVRGAIIADFAEKIRGGWGRNPDGTPQ